MVDAREQQMAREIQAKDVADWERRIEAARRSSHAMIFGASPLPIALAMALATVAAGFCIAFSTTTTPAFQDGQLAEMKIDGTKVMVLESSCMKRCRYIVRMEGGAAASVYEFELR